MTESQDENLRKKRELEARTRRFAVAVFQLLKKLPHDVSTRVIAFQVGKSAPSIGVSYREANRAESRAEIGELTRLFQATTRSLRRTDAANPGNS